MVAGIGNQQAVQIGDHRPGLPKEGLFHVPVQVTGQGPAVLVQVLVGAGQPLGLVPVDLPYPALVAIRHIQRVLHLRDAGGGQAKLAPRFRKGGRIQRGHAGQRAGQ